MLFSLNYTQLKPIFFGPGHKQWHIWFSLFKFKLKDLSQNSCLHEE